MEFTKLVQEFAKIEAQTQLEAANITAWKAPAECMSYVAAKYEKDIYELEIYYNVTFDDIMDELDERIDPNARSRIWSNLVNIYFRQMGGDIFM